MVYEPSEMNWEHSRVSQYESRIPLKIPGYELLYELTDRLLNAVIGSGSARLLVAGAGGGKELALLGERHAGWHFHGVDPSSRMLELAAGKISRAFLQDRITLQLGTVEDVPDSESFDGATCLLVLHFVKGLAPQRSLLQHLAARLKSGAPLFLACIAGSLNAPECEIQLQAWKSFMLDQGIPLEEWEQFRASLGHESDPIGAAEVEALLAETGFTKVSRYYGAFLIHAWMAVKS